jgi:hypothetical protein
MRVLRLMLGIITLSTMLSGCGSLGRLDRGPFRGQIVDADTKAPLVDAVVVLVWYWSPPIGGPGGPGTYFQDAQEAVTDSQGEFFIPGLNHYRPFWRVAGPAIAIFKPGYWSYPNMSLEMSRRPGWVNWEEKFRLGEHVIIELPRTTAQDAPQHAPALAEVPLDKIPNFRRLVRTAPAIR